MTRPTDDQLSRSLSDLGAAAREWVTQGEVLASYAPTYSGHLASGLSLGIFYAVGAKYEASSLALGSAATTGGKKLEEVGNTLDQVKKQYEKDEENNVHLTQGQW